MKEYPRLLNGDMVRATLNDSKSMTRQPFRIEPWGYDPSLNSDGLWEFCDDIDLDKKRHIHKSPFGKPGDRLWVRESWATDKVYDPFSPIQIDPGASVKWIADNAKRVNGPENWGKKRVSIHMPRWASRITLEVKRVWVERIQDISPEDIWKEGITHDPEKYGSIVHTFEDLWDSIYGTWNENPWAWCCEFGRIENE